MADITKFESVEYSIYTGREYLKYVAIYDPTQISVDKITRILNSYDGRRILSSLPCVVNVTKDQYDNMIKPLFDGLNAMAERLEKVKPSNNSVGDEVTVKVPSLCGTTVDFPISSIYAISSIFRSMLKDMEDDKKCSCDCKE